jgi:hypothetical protein
MTNLDVHEVELLILALRFWRAQRRDGLVRRTDFPIPPEAIEVLLAKLEAGRSQSLPPQTGDDSPPFNALPR